MPDIFIPADTSNYSEYYSLMVRRGILSSYVLEYADKTELRLPQSTDHLRILKEQVLSLQPGKYRLS